MQKQHSLDLMPREKLLQLGPQSLTDSELLALFLRTGTKAKPVMELSHYLLNKFGSLHQLMKADLDEFCNELGLGIAKYTQLKAVVELSSRYLKEQIKQSNHLTSPNLTLQYLSSYLADKERELFLVLFLNHQHQIIASKEMFQGTYHSVEVHPREIVKEALKYNAAALILAHNHPSGKAQASKEDKDITFQIQQACRLLDIHILDHIIIGKGEHLSFAQQGWLL